MPLLIVAFLIFTSLSSFGAKTRKDKKPKPFFNPSDFKVIPLNSPVKEAKAKFKLELPDGTKIEYVKVKLVNTRDLRKDQKSFEQVEVQNNSELRISVLKLPPGFYRLYVKVKDRNKTEETQFKAAFQDFARFVIDKTLEVPMPDEKVNNSTLAGVDSDNNGIRDDIQRYIIESYISSPDKKFALLEYAAILQQNLTDFNLKENVIFNTHRMFEASRCLTAIFGEEKRALTNLISKKTFNTKSRIKANIEADRLYHGNMTPEHIANFQSDTNLDNEVFCGFEVKQQ